MHEHVFAGLGGDEAVALVGVEPLHGSNRHVLVPPSTVSEDRPTPTRTLTPTARDKLNPQVAKQNVNLCLAHGDGYGHRPPHRPRPPGCPSMPTRRTRLGCARDPSHPAGLRPTRA